MSASGCYKSGSGEVRRGRPHEPRSSEAVGESRPPRLCHGRSRTVARAAERARITQGRERRKERKESGIASGLCIGIDVSKAALEVAMGSAGEVRAIANEDRAIGELAAELVALEPGLVVMEASGGYERLAAALLWEAGLGGDRQPAPDPSVRP